MRAALTQVGRINITDSILFQYYLSIENSGRSVSVHLDIAEEEKKKGIKKAGKRKKDEKNKKFTRQKTVAHRE
jgi:hypothetical protein